MLAGVMTQVVPLPAEIAVATPVPPDAQDPDPVPVALVVPEPPRFPDEHTVPPTGPEFAHLNESAEFLD